MDHFSDSFFFVPSIIYLGAGPTTKRPILCFLPFFISSHSVFSNIRYENSWWRYAKCEHMELLHKITLIHWPQHFLAEAEKLGGCQTDDRVHRKTSRMTLLKTGNSIRKKALLQVLLCSWLVHDHLLGELTNVFIPLLVPFFFFLCLLSSHWIMYQ